MLEDLLFHIEFIRHLTQEPKSCSLTKLAALPPLNGNRRPACNAKLDTVERANSNGVYEHGRPIDNGRSGKFPQQIIRIVILP